MDDLSITSREVIEELIQAKISTYTNSDAGKYFIKETFDKSLEKFFLDNEYWFDGFTKIFKDFIITETRKAFDLDKSEELAHQLMELGMKSWLDVLGYTITKKED